ncbi:MAG: transposase [Polaribacter sp.]|jgi:transposase
MAILRVLHIKEFKSDLEILRKTSKSHRVKTRILFLLLKQSKQKMSQEKLALQLNVSESSLRRWAKVYSESGLEEMLKISNGGKRRMVITPDVHAGLAIKLQNSSDSLLGYNDAFQWVEIQYGIKFKYNTLRTYMKRHFGI